MNVKRRYFLKASAGVILFLVLMCAACQQQEVIPPQIGYYHWQTNLSLHSSEQTYLEQVQVQSLYIKFFDVDYDSQSQDAEPLAVVEIDTTGWSSLDYTPVVFITNRTFEQLTNIQIDTLASRIGEKVDILWKEAGLSPPRTWQLDCDWTQSTNAPFFRLCSLLKKAYPKRILSATIRLHQVKYKEQTGVPPVDRGTLMFYNMDEVDDPLTENSILDLAVASAYLDRLETYPLALDIALPVYGWAVVFRGDQFIRLIPNVFRSDFDSDRFYIHDETHIDVAEQQYFKGNLLYEGDYIRLEQGRIDDLQKAWEQLSARLPNAPRDLIFYHLEERNVLEYQEEMIQWIQSSLSAQ